MDFGLEDGWCWHHHPAKERERLNAKRKGQRVATERKRAGQVRTVEPSETPGALETAEDAARWSGWVVTSQATGLIDAATARAIQSGIRTFLSALDKSETEARIRELQATVAELKGERPKLGVRRA